VAGPCAVITCTAAGGECVKKPAGENRIAFASVVAYLLSQKKKESTADNVPASEREKKKHGGNMQKKSAWLISLLLLANSLAWSQFQTAIRSAPSSTSAIITWTSSSAGLDFVNYGLTTNYGTTVKGTVAVTAHSLTIPGLTANTKYFFRVRTTDSTGEQVVSPGFSFTTLAGTAHNVVLNWTASATTDVTNYKVYVGTISGGPYSPLATLGNVTTYTDSRTTGTYYYVATALDPSGESAFSNQASAVVP